MNSFKNLGLNEWIVRQSSTVGLTKPTEIQSQCIPHILTGEDVIGCAKTGSGKTAAFALPILQKLADDPYGIFALVLTPTRELAFQIAEQFKVLGKPIGVRVTVITGGLDMSQQGSELSVKPHIVISTPGRLSDHIESCNTFTLKKIRFLVLDEADRLLEDNFGTQLETIFKVLPRKRQTILTSATMTETLKQLQDVAMNKPFFWQQDSKVVTVEELQQTYVLMAADMKDAYLVHIVQAYLEDHPHTSIIIFTSTCKYTQILGMIFGDFGLEVAVLHSMIPQRQRLAALNIFKSNQVRILLATDVASRGLDIPTVDLVINHNVPNRTKDYVHRVGRTARAGRRGLAVTLVTQFDIKLVHAIEAFINSKLVEYSTREKAVVKILMEVAVARREAEIKLDEQDFGEKEAVNKRKKLLLDRQDPDKKSKKVPREKGKRREERKRIYLKKFKKKRNKNTELT